MRTDHPHRESAWHHDTKHALAAALHGATEVPLIGVRHRRADVVAGRLVLELQTGYLPATEITEREADHDRMVWLYSGALFADRIHIGERGGLWIKQGSATLLAHRRPVFVEIAPRVEYLLLGALSHVPARGGRARRLVGRRPRWFSWDEMVGRLARMGGATAA